jgi:hypothetical protein
MPTAMMSHGACEVEVQQVQVGFARTPPWWRHPSARGRGRHPTRARRPPIARPRMWPDSTSTLQGPQDLLVWVPPIVRRTLRTRALGGQSGL